MNYNRLCHNRICRVLICLALICCLIAQMVPARAHATAAGLVGTITGVSSVAVSAPVAVGAMAIALGVMAGTNDDFQYLVNTSVNSGFEWIKDGTVELLRTVDELGNQAFYVAGEFLEDLKTRLFDLELLSSVPVYGTSIPAGTPIYVSHYKYSTWSGYITADKDCEAMFLTIGSSSYLTLVFPSAPSFKNSSGGGINVGDSTSAVVGSSSRVIRYFNRTTPSHNTFACPNYISSSSIAVHDFVSSIYKGKYEGYTEKVGTSYDLSLGQIPTVPVDGSSALDWAPEYQAKRLTVIEGGNDPDPDSDPPNDGKWFWPLALTATTAELFAMSQADQWSGVTPPEFSEYSNSADYEIVSRPEIDGYQGLEIKPVTNPNPGTGTNPDPDIGGDAGGDTGSDIGNQIDYTSWFRRIVELIEELLERFKTWVADCKTSIEELPSKFAKWFDNICETLGNIWEWCQNLVGSLIDALRNLLSSLFSPAPDFIANKVNSLTAKYPYLDTFTGLGGSLKSFFLNLGSKPPIIYIDLGAATGSYFFGGRQAFIDLSWYADYKPTMDAILGAFIWLWLAWRVFHALPGIINGMSGTVGERVSYSGTQNINLPPLPPQNELPPGHNRRM